MVVEVQRPQALALLESIALEMSLNSWTVKKLYLPHAHLKKFLL